MALNRSGINVPLSFLVIPFLVSGGPNLGFATLAASKGPIEIKLRQPAIGVDVRKFTRIGGNRRRMIPLLDRSKAQNSLGLTQLLFGWISSSLVVRAHMP